MIKKIVKLLTNPQGALVQIVIEHIAKIFKLEKILAYVENENELDVAMKNVENKCTEIDLKIKAMQSIIKDLDNIAHPPAIDLDEIKEIKKITDKVKKLRAFKSLG